ncbi:hypothetical protein [Nonomuraea candida]|uniref:hypothetical protein n=1 Tax=Nonomuraea candida TaxID=359159 RepID=UPI0012FAC45A|nr:hypothetical protein [Nonomuraea candida]
MVHEVRHDPRRAARDPHGEQLAQPQKVPEQQARLEEISRMEKLAPNNGTTNTRAA